MAYKILVKDIANKSNMAYLKSYYSYYRLSKTYLEKLLNIFFAYLWKKPYSIVHVFFKVFAKSLV